MRLTSVDAALAGLSTVAVASPTSARAPAHPEARRAKLTIKQAKAIALRTAPGTVVERDYELEDRTWRYSFDIRQGERIHEVGVDAKTGKIVESAYEAAGDKD